ncbi:hypothetical protein BST61_g11127 [Cercospora zeina]
MKLTKLVAGAFYAATAIATQTLSSEVALLTPESTATPDPAEVEILRVRPEKGEEGEEEEEESMVFPVANETLSTSTITRRDCITTRQVEKHKFHEPITQTLTIQATTKRKRITRQVENLEKEHAPSVFHCETFGHNRYHRPSGPLMKRETQTSHTSTSSTPMPTARVHLKDLANHCGAGMVKACDWHYPASVITTSYKTCYCAPKSRVSATAS